MTRPGTASDFPWICQLLSQGAKDGHFGITVPMQAPQMLNAIVNQGGFQILKLRGGIKAPAFIKAKLTVEEIAGQLAAFLITLIDDESHELHLAATERRFRRSGLFKKLVNNEISTASSGTRFTARCYKKSTWASQALLALNFTQTSTGNPADFAFVTP